MKKIVPATILILTVLGTGALESCTVLNLLDPLVGTWASGSNHTRVDCTFYPNQSFVLEIPGGVQNTGVWTRSSSHINLMFDNGELRTWHYMLDSDGKTLTIRTEGARSTVTMQKHGSSKADSSLIASAGSGAR